MPPAQRKHNDEADARYANVIAATQMEPCEITEVAKLEL